jgi:hypothetical protein
LLKFCRIKIAAKGEVVMIEDEEKPFTVSREDLYELVWSKPMRELARDFGISDVALAKRCRRLAIPVPGRGYWARVDAGQQPYRPQLPKRDSQWFDDGALTVGPSRYGPADSTTTGHAEGGQDSDGGRSTAQLDKIWLGDRLGYEEQPSNAIAIPAITRDWHPTIEKCRDDLEDAAEKLRASKEASDKYEKRPAWRKRTQFDSDGYAWRSVQDRGQRLRNTHKAVCFRVSLGTYKRALSIVNALALAAPERGFAVREDDQEGRIVFAGCDAEIKLRITEPLEQKTRPRSQYDGTIEQEKFQVPTGRLRITLQIGHQEGPAFEDQGSLPLESQLNRAFCAIYRLVVKAWRREREHQAFNRRLEEEARLRAEEARLQAEREKAIAEERERRRRLSAEANRWAQSIRIKGYVEHIRKSAVERLNTSAELNEWTQWALSVAAELDPTEERVNQDLKESPVDS